MSATWLILPLADSLSLFTEQCEATSFTISPIQMAAQTKAAEVAMQLAAQH